MKKIIMVVALLGLCIGCLLSIKKNQKNNSLTVGIAANYAPWISINSQNEYEGFDIDVIKAVAQEMNVPLVLNDLGSMSSLLIALDQGKVDAVIWGMSIVPERLKKMAMVRYQGEVVTSYPLLFWNSIPKNITSIKDLKNKIVCVEPASSQDTVLKKYSYINKLVTEKIDDALLNIQYGRADAAFVEPAIANKFVKKYPEIKTLDVLLDKEDQVQGVGICIKKNNIKLINQLEQAAQSLNQNGTIKVFEQRKEAT
ncbi:MAG: ABC-type amino acid transport substrate-binding protein [Alteromonas naphthalenivorans]|jgi:ABC-type amino acid transport substrate-binding protein